MLVRLICIWYLFFSFFTNHFDIDEQAKDSLVTLQVGLNNQKLEHRRSLTRPKERIDC